ncbi:MAG: glycosyltransferase family 2 protein [Longimicrobiaceae bacterium]
MIYICIPALNEARTIGVLLWKIRQVMDEFPRDYHVLVLDDGSTDDTREVLEPYLRVLPVTVLRNERTQGYAAGLERLIREAANRSTHPKRDVVVTLQADFTESPDDIPLLLKKLEGGADVVGVTVTATEGELPRAVRWSRRGLPWLLSGAKVPKELGDPLTGFRAYRVAVLRRALQDREGQPLLTKHGWAANAELLLCVLPHVRRAEGAEVSLRYTRRERPTRFRPWSTALELWDLARKAPRRLAQARARADAADARGPAPAPQPGPRPQPPAERPAASGTPAPQRSQRAAERPAERAAAGAPAGQRPQRQGERPAASGSPAAPPAPRPPRPERKPAATVAAAPAEPAVEVTVGESAPAGQEKPKRPKRRRSSRRKSAAAQSGAAPETDAAESAVSTDAPESSAPAAEGTAEAGDMPATPKRSRPRRPRRPRSKRPSGEAGGEGESSGANDASPEASGGGDAAE